MADPRFSTLVRAAGSWTDPTPPYDQLLNHVGGGAATDRATVHTTLCSLATRTPTVLAFVLQGSSDSIFIGYHPTSMPVNPLAATPMDGRLVVLVGNDVETSVPVVLNQDHTGRTGDIVAFNRDYIIGANGYAAAPPVRRFDHQAAGAPDTGNVRVRYAMLIPPAIAADVLEATDAHGRFNLHQFYHELLRADAESGDPAREAAILPLVQWWPVTRIPCR